MTDRDEADPGPAFGALGAQVDEEAIVRTRAREREFGVFDLARREPGAERRRLHTGDRVGIGEDDLGRDTVGVHFLVALCRVVRAAQPFFVRGLPVGDVVVVQHHLLVTVRLPLGEELVERVEVTRVEVRPVVLTREPRVRVGGDDRVAVAHDLSFAPSTDRSS